MAKFWFTKTLEAAIKGDLDLSGADLRIKLCMANNTCVTDRATAVYLDDITDIDEYDGTGYTEITCAGLAISTDGAVPQVEVKVNSGSWGSAVGAGTRNAVGYLVYQRIGSDPSANPVLGYSTEGGFPLNGSGGPFTLTADAANGLLTLA
jgi:hypothetical protein